MTNHCPRCGTINPPRAQFCSICKAPLRASVRNPPPIFPTGQLAIGQVLWQRYRIIKQVGMGGMGAVYKAADTQLGDRVVAVKEMSQSNLSPRELFEAVAAFQREAFMLAQLTHPHLPRIYDHFTHAGRWYLVMDFIEGETLEHYLYKTLGRPLPVEEALEIGIQLCSVLDYLHTRHPPIVFRDLKPGNVMRTPQGHLYLIDFGIARHFKTGQARDTIQSGTPGYSAPEMSSQQSDPRSDIYSLGVTLHQLLTADNPAQRPFHFTRLRSRNPSIPVELERLLVQMVALDPNNRPASMAIIKQQLQDILAQWMVNMRTPDKLEEGGGRRRRRRVTLVKRPGLQSRTSALMVEEGQEPGRIYELTNDIISIGRSRESDIFLQDLAVSRTHATLFSLGSGNYALRDEGSANGTRLNGQMVKRHQRYPLTGGDRIQVGGTIFVFNKY